MSFARYMIGFLLLMALVVWAAVVVGVPDTWLAVGLLTLLVGGIAVAVQRTRGRDFPPH